ncbi:hypothetical protein ABZ753_21640 [Streptomyces griseoincarnatus]
MTWKPSTPTGAVHQDCIRCGAPVLHQKHGLPFTVTADAERLTPAQATSRTTRNRLTWCLRESKWAGARRVAFLIANGREPEGRVLAGCGWRECVAPAHVTDRPMRVQLNTQYAAIFGAAA